MNRILIMSCGNSDFSEMIKGVCDTAEQFDFSEYENVDFDAYDAFAFLGGLCDEAKLLPPPLRVRVESLRQTGKPVFTEFIRSVGYHGCGKTVRIDHQRMMMEKQAIGIDGICPGDLLDGHYNDCCKYDFLPRGLTPILSYYEYINAHAHIDPEDQSLGDRLPALWMLGENTMVCSMRLCNFNRARFAPRERWHCVIRHILSFLAGEAVTPVFPEPICRFEKNAALTQTADIDSVVRKGLDWFCRADMLIENGRGGVREGLSHHISAQNGLQKRENLIRTDCSGETGGAFMMDWLLTGNAESKKRFEDLEAFCFTYMQEKTGAHKGMLRWTDSAWGICYQDDVARAILPTLLCQNYTKEGSRHFEDAVDALRYLLRTTGPNGLRTPSTAAALLNEELEQTLRETDLRSTTKAHHNSFYQAMLLLAYRAGGPRSFLEPAVRGLTTIMSLYPENERETSETEEMCRLIFPLSVLYQITGEEKHKAWLYRVAEDLARVQHTSGAFCEWDTGYRAACSRRKNGECALLANNGDPVVDLLYSNNWLPLGFAYAYMVTKDRYFYQQWLAVARFLVRCQVHSDDPTLDGSWSRGFDVSRWEIYGVPHDTGWSPCCVETGWTMGEILMGLQFMKWIEGKAAVDPLR